MRVVSILAVLCVGTLLRAGEGEIKNANEFLATLKTVDKSICKVTRYRVMLKGGIVGSAQLSITASEFDKQPCYRVEGQIAVRLGERNLSNVDVSYISPDMRALFVSSQSREDGLPDGSTTWTYSSNTYTKTKTAKDGSITTRKVDGTQRLLLGSSEDLVGLLLPKETVKAYEFVDWTEDDGLREQLFNAKGASTYGRFKGTRVSRVYAAKVKNRRGVEESKTYTDELLVNEAGQIAYQSVERHSLCLELDDGDVSIEAIRQFERPIDPVLAFCRGMATKDETLVSESVNVDAYVDEYVKRDASMQNKTEFELALIKGVMRKEFTKTWVEKVDISARLKTVFNGLSSDDYDLKFEHSDRARLVLNEHFHKRTGDDSVSFFIVERDLDTGKWKFVWISTKDDEF